MLAPKKVKHRKWHKSAGTSGKVASRFTKVNFGDFGIQALTPGRITARQIEAARRVMVRFTRKGGKIWIRIFPDKPITSHGNEMKMGKGKGAPESFVAVVRPGTVMMEIGGIAEDQAIKALSLAGYKFPVKTKVVSKF